MDAAEARGSAAGWQEAPLLPPAFRAVACAGPPFERARAEAAEAGAGTLYWRRAPGALALAVVLEPATPLAAARAVFPVAMGALADALAAHCLPERAVALRWPSGVVLDHGRIGVGRLAWPEGTAETAVPDWLVFGADLIADRDGLEEPGRHPASTSLREQDIPEGPGLVESFARHFLLHMDAWEARGYGAAVEPYVARLAGLEEGARPRLTERGDLLVQGPAGVATERLVAGLAAEPWWDAAAGAVRW